MPQISYYSFHCFTNCISICITHFCLYCLIYTIDCKAICLTTSWQWSFVKKFCSPTKSSPHHCKTANKQGVALCLLEAITRFFFAVLWPYASWFVMQKALFQRIAYSVSVYKTNAWCKKEIENKIGPLLVIIIPTILSKYGRVR